MTTEMAGGLHIAWLGPVPMETGGVAAVGTQLVAGLADQGHRLDCFFPAKSGPLPAALEARDEVRVHWADTGWEWGHWYSRHRVAAFGTGLIARGIAFRRLGAALRRMHASDPFDIIYQFSNIETVGVPASVLRTAPLVMHPETHIAGELRWWRAEADLVRRCEGLGKRMVIRCVLEGRSWLQRRSVAKADRIVCISRAFRDELVSDYGVDPSRTVVVPNPVDATRFTASGRSPADAPVVLVLGRVSVRKGVDQVVAVSHLLADREVAVRIRIVGGHTLWSDYRLLLKDMAGNAEYVGAVSADQVAQELQVADVLVQASKYEPFGLTVGEALASGVPVVATTAVGAAEDALAPSTARVPVGDPDALADAIEAMIATLRADPVTVRASARAAAVRLFAPKLVTRAISDALVAVSGLSITSRRGAA